MANAVNSVEVSAYTIPTDAPESDGTFSWTKTTLVLVELTADGQHGIGYTYADTATARLIKDLLADLICGSNALAIPAAWGSMNRAIRNLGRPGIASMAIAAVDSALWDLKAKLLGVPLVALLGEVRDSAPIYGSGGFTSYSINRLREQLSGWVNEGIPRVKMKVGTDPEEDLKRVGAARGNRAPSRAFRGCEWGIHPQASTGVCREVRRPRRILVRGAGPLG